MLISCFQDKELIKNEPSPVSTQTSPSSLLVEPTRNTYFYNISDSFFQNPERGFSSEAELDSDFYEYYEDGVTLVYITIQLYDYRETEIPELLLNELDASLIAMRSSGVKAILRFAYNDGPYPYPDPDASLEQILSHIEQIKPVLQKNADVISWLEAGFIGAWGEWHASTNDLDNSVEAKQQILFALLDAMPSDRSVLLRYPVDIITFFPAPLTSESAINNSDQARVGFHNDCFLASSNDENTYGRDNIFSYDDELSYLNQTTQFVLVGGESCAYNPPRSDCPSALHELEYLHFTELGDGWHPDVLSSWEEQGCYVEIEDRLGYRLSLLETTVNQTVKPGGVLNLEVKIINEGFAPPINPRPVYLILEGPTRQEVLLPVNPRLWLPNQEISIQVKARLPFDIPEGEYKLALWLPDPYLTLRDNPRYSIKFANENIWDQNFAYNILQTITVDTLALGSVDLTSTSFEIIE